MCHLHRIFRLNVPSWFQHPKKRCYFGRKVVGNRIKAVVAVHEPGSVQAAELQQYCATRIPTYMIPELIEFRGSLPKTSTGKVDRVELSRDSQPLAV